MEIAAILTGLLLLCLLLLSMPVDLGFSFKKDATLLYEAELCLLLGLVTIRLSDKNSKPEKKVLQKGRKKKKAQLASAFRSKGFVKRIVRLVRDLLHSLQVKELNLHLHIGLDDPADTGMLVGLFQTFLPGRKRITLKADFQEAVFEGSCLGKIRIFPILIIGHLFAFAFSPATMSAVKNAMINRDDPYRGCF